MSRITYCSLEEAWGKSFDRNEQQPPNKNNENRNSSQPYYQQTKNNDKIYERNKYDKLIQDSDDNRRDVINNMNKIERNYLSDNSKNSLVEYNKYRFNKNNNVKEADYNNDVQYTPFQDSLEKKYLQDKILHLENEFNKYKNLVNANNSNNDIEHFQNDMNYNNNSNNNYSSNKDNDIIDLIVLIIIGLLVIFVLNSIFNIGKAIGARNK